MDLIVESGQDATLAMVRGVDSVGSYSGMGGVCWVFPRVALLAVTSGKFVC